MIKAKFIGVVLGALMLLCGAAGAGAATFPAYGPNCEQRIVHRRAELDKAIRRHGFRSWQAERERRELRRAEYVCR